MCSRFTGVDIELIKSYYRVAAPDDLQLIMEYDQQYLNGWEHPFTIILGNDGSGKAAAARWGLIPSTIQENPDEFVRKYATLNAKIETVKTKPAFRNSINNRCLVPSSAFFEFQWTNPEKKNCKKIEHRIRTVDGQPFAFAGLYNTWNGMMTFTILTTQANGLMAEIHNSKERMPVILKKEDEQRYLAGAPLEEFAYPYQAGLVAEPVNPDNKPLPGVQGSLF